MSGFTEDVLIRGDRLIVARGNQGVSLHSLDGRDLSRVRVGARNVRHPDLSRLREGDRVGLVLPRTLLCRP